MSREISEPRFYAIAALSAIGVWSTFTGGKAIVEDQWENMKADTSNTFATLVKDETHEEQPQTPLSRYDIAKVVAGLIAIAGGAGAYVTAPRRTP